MMLSMIRARTRFHQPDSTTPSGVVGRGDCQPSCCPYAGIGPPCGRRGAGRYSPGAPGAPWAPCEPGPCGRSAAGATPYGIPMVESCTVGETFGVTWLDPVSYTHLRAHETD